MQPKFDNQKPIVVYGGEVQFRKAHNTETGETREYAIVHGPLQHPRLGRMGFREYVITSLIELKSEDGETFETQNTLYKRG